MEYDTLGGDGLMEEVEWIGAQLQVPELTHPAPVVLQQSGSIHIDPFRPFYRSEHLC